MTVSQCGYFKPWRSRVSISCFQDSKFSPLLCIKALAVISLVVPLVILSAVMVQERALWRTDTSPVDSWALLFRSGLNPEEGEFSSESLITNHVGDRSKENKCLSRTQHMLHRPRSQIVTSNPALLSAFAAYEQLHAACSSAVSGNWTNLLLRSENSPDQSGHPDCQVLVFLEGGAGLGNRLSSFITAFLYALMTDRIFLVDTRESQRLISELLCEPFTSSSWLLPEDFPYELVNDAPALGKALEVDFNEMKNVLNLNLENSQSEGDQWFFCAETRERIQSIPWLTWTSNQYFLPRLFTFPELWPRLLTLFPDASLSFTYLSRLLLLPNNRLWERIFRVHSSYLASADKLVGVQIRRHGVDNSVDFSAPAYERILHCLVDNHILPLANTSVVPSSSFPTENMLQLMDLHSEPGSPLAKDVLKSGGDVTAVLIASLQQKYAEELQNLYTNYPTTDGSLVRVHMVTHEGMEFHSSDQAEKAFVEMWLLSMSDEIVTSGYSTFGYVAQGLGALRPFIVNLVGDFTKDDLPSCSAGLSPEPCNHFSFWPKDNCGNASALTPAHEKWINTSIFHCQDYTAGIQLVPRVGVTN